MTLLWTLLWLPFSIAAHLELLYEPSGYSVGWPDLLRALRWAVLTAGLWGSASGAMFSGLLATAERGASIRQLGVRRVIVLGAISGASLPTCLQFFAALQVGWPAVAAWRPVSVIGMGAAYGALVAGGLLRLARRTPAA